MAKVATALFRNLMSVQIYGANTGVGKTVLSTLLGAHFGTRFTPKGTSKYRVEYIKPVSTGPLDDSDQRYVQKYTGQEVTTLYQFKDPVSPHVAAQGAPHRPSDEQLTQQLSLSLEKSAIKTDGKGIVLVETAGGVLSPAPSGKPQADVFRPLRLPAILVGDHRLGGIASTISAAESLIIRGYDIDLIICFDDRGMYKNADYLERYFKDANISAVTVPWIPDVHGINQEAETGHMSEYYKHVSQGSELHDIASRLEAAHETRLDNMQSMAKRTNESIWHPFTQHKHIKSADDILVFDSAYGDYFQVKQREESLAEKEQYGITAPLLYPAFDGSASWWTQGLGHGNPTLALQAGYAAGRYGHVMFAGATHEPALSLAERLLKGLENPRLKKVFYTDNGSTATETGIKMALRASCKRYGWNGAREEVGVLGLKGSYHGDTIGAMDASEPSVFNEKVDWYRGRGYWFDYPTFKLVQGRFVVEAPQGMEQHFGPRQHFDSINDIFDLEQRGASTYYDSYITTVMDQLVKEEGRKFGALIMEPVILGAGGMLFVDPLFQQSLVRIVRQYSFSDNTGSAAMLQEQDPYTWTGLPVMFDEVFTGLYRLGRFSSASFLGVHPDVSVHAKLLTGGLLPLSTTVASKAIFDAFWGDDKSDALLHGHSYTAHPIGCHVANVSLEAMHKLNTESSEWHEYRRNWKGSSHDGVECATQSGSKWSMWTHVFVLKLSKHKRVEHVNALGSVLAVALKDSSGSGYSSGAAIGLRDALLSKGSIHSRVLGNVIYLMASMTSKPQDLLNVERTFIEVLDTV